MIELFFSLCYQDSLSREVRCQHGVSSSPARTRSRCRKYALRTNQNECPSVKDADLFQAQLKNINKHNIPRRSQKARPFLRPMPAFVYTRSHTSLTRIIDQHTFFQPFSMPQHNSCSTNLKTKPEDKFPCFPPIQYSQRPFRPTVTQKTLHKPSESKLLAASSTIARISPSLYPCPSRTLGNMCS